MMKIEFNGNPKKISISERHLLATKSFLFLKKIMLIFFVKIDKL